MKHTIITLALILALAMSCVAMAEETPSTLPTDGTDIVEEMPTDAVPDVPDAASDATASNEPAGAVPTDDLKAAMDAYRAAKQDKAVDDLEEELDGYVEEGSLTQEQADLILSSVKERIAAKNGECPNCGYKFRNSDKGGRGAQQQFPGQKQFSGQQKQFPGQNQMPSQDQFPGQQNHFHGQQNDKQGGCQQNQCPGMQGNQDKKQFHGKQQVPGDQQPDAQSGATPRDNSRNQMPGQKPFSGQQNGNQMMPGNQKQFSGQQNGGQRGNQMMPGMAPQM